jgi:hypothetical protein
MATDNGPANIATRLRLRACAQPPVNNFAARGITTDNNVGNKMIVAGSLDSLSLRDLAKEQGISMLCVFEDDLQGKDSLKSNLFFEAKKLNIVFKTY